MSGNTIYRPEGTFDGKNLPSLITTTLPSERNSMKFLLWIGAFICSIISLVGFLFRFFIELTLGLPIFSAEFTSLWLFALIGHIVATYISYKMMRDSRW